jgi:hypothetical protein
MQTLFIVAGGVVVLLLVAAMLIMIPNRVSTSGRADDREGDRQLDDRLKHPLFDEVEAEFESRLPEDLRWLYGQPDLISKRNIRIKGGIETAHEYEIDHFLPVDLKTLRDLWFDIGKRRFPFAIDGFGNYFFIDLHDGHAEATTSPVFYIDHDGGAVWPVAHSLRNWLSQSRSSS